MGCEEKPVVDEDVKKPTKQTNKVRSDWLQLA